MKNFYLTLVAILATVTLSFGQITFEPQVDFETVEVPNWIPSSIIMPASPLKMQILFVGATDMVQHTAIEGRAGNDSTIYDVEAGESPAKQWHDFIGFTPDTVTGSEDLGWVSINHEMIIQNDNLGDGGGMSVFKVKRDADTDSLIIVDQTLSDGREGKFFNVDFVNTVGETGMNCGGITAPDGRIWTAEEWFRSNTGSIYDDGEGVRDTADFTITSDLPGDFDGSTIRKFENFNYMVEIDPREAVAIRKQYNWGRMPYEGGVIMEDMRTVYLGADATPGYYVKFVADEAGDFTQGRTFVYKHDIAEKWVEVNNTSIDSMLALNDIATELGATMFNRLEWGAVSDGKVYWTETGRDNPASRWVGEFEDGAVFHPIHLERAAAQSAALTAELIEEGDIPEDSTIVFGPEDSRYEDIYGRVWVHDLETDEITSFIEGGYGDPELYGETFNVYDYNRNNLSNPDGLNFITVNPGTEQENTYMIICEDLNGADKGRMPRGITENRTCELWLLDMNIENPNVDDLVRITAVPRGAEVTGAIATPDGKTMLVNSQHPSSTNPFPFNNSLTFAITGWTEFEVAVTPNRVNIEDNNEAFAIYPNPVSRTVFFDKTSDVGIYTIEGKLVKVANKTKSINVSDLAAGTYVIMNGEGAARKFIVK